MSYLKKIKGFIKAHKIISLVIGVIIVLGGRYVWAKTRPPADAKYVLATVEKGTILSSVSGTGTVSTENQVDLKAKSSGQILRLPAVPGQQVSQGDLIASLDSRDAYVALQTAQVALNKLLEPADKLALIQNQNALQQSYNDGFNGVAAAFVDMPVVVQGLYDLLYKSGGYLTENYTNYQGIAVTNLRALANSSFGAAKSSLDNLSNEYSNTPKSTEATDKIEKLVNDTYDTLRLVSQAVKDAKNTVDELQIERSEQTSSVAVAAEGNLATWTSKINADLQSVLGNKASITNNKEALAKLERGTDELDIESARLNLLSRQNAYDDSFVRAPFDGTVARVPVRLYDNVSNGTVVATMITKNQYAEISLNEVDVVKVKAGQKSTITFDAIPGLSITGEVAQVDTVGISNQGVVTYNVKIKFDTDDPRVKPGMSASASIVTEIRTNVLKVANSAIKTSSGNRSVQVVSAADKNLPQTQTGVTLTNAPQAVEVEIGLQSDSETEIISGLNAGEVVVVRTISSSAAQPTAPSAFSLPGTRTTGGGGGSQIRAISH